MAEETKEEWIAGFWGRIGALLIDSLILGAIGFSLGLFLKDYFIQIGPFARLVGFAIALVYFGIMNSKLCNGQTIGKKLLKIRVVNPDNVTISLPRSFSRYIILGIPFFLNGIQFPGLMSSPYLLCPFSLIVFGGIFSIVYLYIFNRVTRQSLHDLIAGTYVVRSESDKQVVGKIWKGHFVAVLIIFAAAAIIPVWTISLASKTPFREMLTAYEALSKEDDIVYVTVTTGFNTTSNSSRNTTFVSSTVFLNKNEINNVDRAREIARILIHHYPDAVNKDSINITLSYGYSIGIWSQWSSFTHSFKPSDLTGKSVPSIRQL